MEIDLQQLPIPDWGLMCPSCRYPLLGLPAHRCPECGTAFEIADLVRSWTRLRPPWFSGNERPVPAWGLQCGKCDAPLEGQPGDRCEQCGADIRLDLAPPRGPWFMLDRSVCGRLALAEVLRLLQAELVPHFRSDERNIAEIAVGGGPVDGRYRAASEFYFDVCYLVANESRYIDDVRRLARETSWQCGSCGEENPGNFEVCWNCGDGRSDDAEPIEPLPMDDGDAD